MATNNENSKLMRLPNVVLLTVGAMIGSAIFSLSGLSIASSGSGAILSWILAGIILFIYGILATYLAHIWPKSGGMFTFPANVLAPNNKIANNIIGSISTILYLGGCLAGVLFSLQYIGIYCTVLFPELSNQMTLISIIAALIVFSINCLNMRNTGRINATLTVILIIILLAYILTIFTSGMFDISKVFTSFDFNNALGDIPTAMLAYGSIVVPAFIVSSVHNSKRTVPITQCIAISITILLYILAIIATLGVKTQSDFAGNPGMQYTPFDFALSAINNNAMPVIVNIGAILALLTTAIVVTRLSAVSVMQFSENDILPDIIGSKLKQNIPNQIIVLIIMLICLLSGVVAEFVVNVGAVFNSSFIVLICVCAAFCFVKERISSKTSS